MTETRGAITNILFRVSAGEPEAWHSLLPVVYGDLRGLARACMRDHGPGSLLQPTALVNETYLRLLRQKVCEWKNRAHFFGVAALLMRRILVDEVRRRNVSTRVLGQLGDRHTGQQGCAIDLQSLDEALTRLTALDPRQAEVVQLRYFGGLTIDETAEFLGVSPKTVKRDWEMARVWLRAELQAAG